MAASESVTALLDQLIDLFNRRSMDLPDGFIARQAQFRLNGIPFEEMLGVLPSDPLVLMLARGPAGYRFTAKAVHHAIPDVQLQRGDLEEALVNDTQVVTGACWLSGHFRDSRDQAELLVGLEMTIRRGAVERVNTTIDPSALARLQEARLRT